MKVKIYWIIYPLVIFCIIFTSCKNNTIGGNGKVQEHSYVLEPFHSMSIKGSFEVHICRAKNYSVTLIADENLIPVIHIQSADSVLEIYPEKNIIRSKELKLIINTPSINKIVLSGASEIISDSIINTNQLYINISGTGRLQLAVETNIININISGGADMNLKGKTNQLLISITGIGKIEAEKLIAENCTLDISGYGHALLNVKNQLNMNISGYGRVTYIGEPIIKQSITGSLKIKKFNE